MKTKLLTLFFTCLLFNSVFAQDFGGTLAGNQTICYNTIPANAITTTASPTCGGNRPPRNSLIWQKSTDGGSSWTDIPNTDLSSYRVTTALTGSISFRLHIISCSVYSNVVTITVLPAMSAGSVGSNQSVCYNGTPSAFTSSAPASGSNNSFSYDWKYSIDNGSSWVSTGGTSTTYQAPTGLIQNTLYVRVATNTFGCGSVTTNTITLTSYPALTSGSIGDNQSICNSSTPANFYSISLPTGGNGSYSYNWKKSINGGSSWDNIVSNTTSYTEPSNLTNTTIYKRVVTSGTCGSAESNGVTASVYPALTGGAILGTQTIPYNTTASNFTNSDNPAGGNGTYAYAWKKSVNGGTSWTDIIGAGSNAYTDPSTLTVTTKYKRISTSGSCGSAESNTITVTVLPQLLGGSISGTQTACYNSVPSQLANATSPSGGTGSFTYAWKKSVNGGSSWDDVPVISTDYYNCPALTQTTLFKRIATSGTSGSAESNTITVTVLPQLTSGAILASQTISYNTAPAPFTNDVSPTGGTGAYAYLWKQSVNGGAVWTDIDDSNTDFYSSVNLTVNTLFKRVVTSGTCGSAESNTLTITVFSPLVGGSIADNQTLCNNTIPAAFSNVTLPSGGTGTFTYQWKKSVNSGSTWADIPSANASTYAESSSLTVTTAYKRVATSGGFGSTESNIVTVMVYPALSGGSINTNQTLCYATKPASFTSVTLPSGGSGSFSYQWQKSIDLGSTWVDIPVATSEGYTDINNLTVTTKYKRLAIFGCGTVESNIITAFVLPALNGGGVTADQTLCYNLKPATFNSSSDPIGSSTFTFQWQMKEEGHLTWSDIPTATALSYTEPNNLTTSTMYKRLANSNGCGTVESNSISITVYPALTGGSIAADQTICNSTIPAAFSNVAFPSGATGSYLYTWKKSVDNGSVWTDINSANNATFAESLNLTNTTVYKRIATSGTCGSAESNTSKITVLPAFVSGTIGTPQTICNGANALALSGTTPTGADGIYTFQWQSSPDNTNWANLFGETEATYQPLGLTASTYYKRIALNAYCSNSVSSNPIQVTVREKVLKPSVAVNGYYCKNSNVSLAISNPNSSSYKWYSSANVLLLEGSQITFPPLTADFTVSVISTLSNGCSSEPLTLSVNVDPIKAHFSYDVSTVTVGNAVRFSNTSENANYYRWNFFDGDAIFERNPTHYYNNCNGTYERKYDVSLLVRSSNNCIDSLILYNAITVKPLVSSVDDQVLNSVKVYPNPLTDNLTVRSDNPIQQIQVYNALGLIIGDETYSNQSLVQINFSRYAQGVYFVKVISGNGNIQLKKVIKK